MFEVDNLAPADALVSLLGQLELGREVVIARQGRPIARLIRASGPINRDEARRAAADIIASSAGVTLGGISTRDLIAEGRM